MKVTLFYDVVSPFSFVAFKTLQRYRGPWKTELILRPTYLGGVMVTAENKPPATVLAKAQYMHDCDVPIISEYYGITLKHPKTFPVNTIHLIRFLRIVQEKAPDKVEALTDIFYGEIWGQNAEAEEAVKLTSIPRLVPSSILSPSTVKEYLELSQSNENKERIKGEAAKLVEDHGAFGFPWILVERDDGQTRCFFGSDRFEYLAFWAKRKWSGPFPEGRPKL